MEDPNKKSGRAPPNKRLKNVQEEINDFLKEREQHLVELSIVLSRLNDPVLMFTLTRSAHADRTFMEDKNLWRPTARLYFQFHIQYQEKGDEDALSHFEMFLKEKGFVNFNYFRMMLALHLVKYHLLVLQGDNSERFENVSEITNHMDEIMQDDIESVRYKSKSIRFESPVDDRSFDVQFEVTREHVNPVLGEKTEYSINIGSTQLAPDFQSEVNEIRSVAAWYPELESYLGIHFEISHHDGWSGWGSNAGPRWSNWEELFFLVYRLLELPGIFVRLPLNKRTTLINKKVVF